MSEVKWFDILLLMTKSEKLTGVLYRKYRPQTFKDVIGQDHIVKVLESVNYNKSKTAEILGIDRGTHCTYLFEMRNSGVNGR